MNLRPILDKIIVKAHDAEKQTAGGLIIASAKNEGIVKADILAAGPGAYDDKGKFISVSAQVGSTILFNIGSGMKFKHEDVEYYTITEKDIIAVLS